MSKVNANELYHALHRLNRQMHRVSHRECHGRGGLYHGQANLLLLIGQNDGASQRDLAELLDVRPSSMTEMLARLEQDGLIEKKQDDKDQRVMHIYLTEKGRKEAETMNAGKDAFAESLFQALTDEEQEQMLALVGKLSVSLGSAEDSYENEIRHGHGAGAGCCAGHHHGGYGMYGGHGYHDHGHYGDREFFDCHRHSHPACHE